MVNLCSTVYISVEYFDDCSQKGKKWLPIKFVLFQNVFHKTGYPSSVWYILGNEFCERFSYYGMHGKVKTISKTQTN